MSAQTARKLHSTSPLTAHSTPLDGKTLELLRRLQDSLKPFLVGKERLGKVILSGVLAGGHILFEDIPGIGKTTLIRALARLLGTDVSRVQCTSDLLPSDVLGVEVYSAKREEFVFHPGPIFSHFVLVDELNRTSPRTQSALLEAMGESRVTINRKSHPLPQPFLVFATQNPSDNLGTYPLPESQLDRFAARVRLSYPADAQEWLIFSASRLDPLESIERTVGEPLHIIGLQQAAEAVHLSDRVVSYAKRFVDATRTNDGLKLGVSTRGGVTWLRMARGHALLEGRDYVTPDDLITLAVPCLGHRVQARASGADTTGILESILAQLTIE